MVNHRGILLVSLLMMGWSSAYAQGLPGQDDTPVPQKAQGGSGKASAPSTDSTNNGNVSTDSEIEALYDKDDTKPAAKPAPSTEQKTEMNQLPKAKTLSDLAKLAPFSDVAVIQRRFLPKTGRFEFSVSGITNVNNPFFSAYGVAVDMAYYFREKWALELIGDWTGTAARGITQNLQNNLGITTTNLVTATSFYGAAIKWNPVYGKMTWLNHSIVPFDLNFSAGGGLTHTIDGQGVGAVHVGTSQVFAITKGIAVRWELDSNIYSAQTGSQNARTNVVQTDIYLGLGISFYFPEASYR